MPYSKVASNASIASLRDAAPQSFWLDSKLAPATAPTLTVDTSADLVVVGGGYTGLWTALQAKEADPDRDVLLLEAGVCGGAASGRNGGFVDASLTHGFANGLQRFPDELRTLIRLGDENLDGLEVTLKRYHIDADFRRSGGFNVATEPYQVEALAAAVSEGVEYGQKLEFWDRDRMQAEIHSPVFEAGLLDVDGVALVDPARLAWGLRQACLDLGVRIFEHTGVTGLVDDGSAITLKTAHASVRARRVALATNAFPPLLRRLRSYVLPVYDYVLMTEPLTPAQWDSIGWAGRHGLSDSGNQFHYFRPTADGRILWGGYDAVYHWNNGVGPHLDQSPKTFGLLAEHFFEVFPQLTGLRFSHAWGGAIDTCTRFTAFWGLANRGRVGYVLGFTGLGVAATRFGAATVLDLLDGADTERTRLEMVRSKPLPLPGEPLRSIGVGLTRWSLDRADRAQGRRNPWLRTLDRFGLGFDS
ncbi:MAG: FAD-dependent oxidoreductase [Actinomycetes bacterium]